MVKTCPRPIEDEENFKNLDRAEKRPQVRCVKFHKKFIKTSFYEGLSNLKKFLWRTQCKLNADLNSALGLTIFKTKNKNFLSVNKEAFKNKKT